MKQLIYKLLNRQYPIPLYYGRYKLWGWKPIKMIKPHEPETVAFFKRVIGDGMIVADVGAHVGFYTVLLSDLVGKHGKVYAFEPDPKSIKLTKKAIAHKKNKRGWNNIHLIDAAVAGGYGKKTLSGKLGSGRCTIIPSEEKILTVDTCLLPDNVEFAKIDAEGSELEILRAMKPIPCTVEYSSNIIKDMDITGEDFIQEIEKLGYNIYNIEKDGSIKPFTHREVQGHINLYLEPK